VILKLFGSQIEVESANEYFGVGVRVGYFRIVRSGWTVARLGGNLYVRVGLVHSSHESRVLLHARLLALSSEAGSTATSLCSDASSLSSVIICGLDVDSLVKDEVTLSRVFVENSLFALSGALLVSEANQNKTEATSSLGCSVAHDDSIDNLTEAGEIFSEMFFSRREGKSTNK
jgi:hypothetical protein